MELLSDSIFYYSQVLRLLGFPVYGPGTWRRSNNPPPARYSGSLARRGVIITLNLWSGGSAGQLFQLGFSSGSPSALMEFKRIIVNYWHHFHFHSVSYGGSPPSSSLSGDRNYSAGRNSTSDNYMIDRNSRDAVIIIMTADVVSLRGTTCLCNFPQRHNLQHTRRTRSASEMTTLPGIIVIWKRRQLGTFGNVG